MLHPTPFTLCMTNCKFIVCLYLVRSEFYTLSPVRLVRSEKYPQPKAPNYPINHEIFLSVVTTLPKSHWNTQHPVFLHNVLHNYIQTLYVQVIA